MKRLTDQEIDALAPIAPDCFETRHQWLQYIAGAVEDTKGDRGGPLVIKAGEPVIFNYRFNFCADCVPAHEAAMCARGKCKPWHLKQLAKERQDSVSTQAR